MGCFGSKDKLSKEDMDFLKSHTRYDEATIKEWYKGFKVSTMPSMRYLFLFFMISLATGRLTGFIDDLRLSRTRVLWEDGDATSREYPSRDLDSFISGLIE